MPSRSCNCQTTSLLSTSCEETIESFYKLRCSCPALQLTIPDSLVNEHREFTSAPPDKNHHCSIPFKAFQHGHLADFTESLHRFAVDGTKIRANLVQQYINDLSETWISEEDALSRYKKSRIYQSRLAELHFALWLEKQKWKITNLEMHGGRFDVEASQNSDSSTSFEVKYLGQREVLFELVQNSFVNPCTTSLSVYSPVDYLLFRLYEASQQLQNANTKKIAVAIIKDYDLSFSLPLNENWIDWNQPIFLRKDSEIQEFLNGKYAENPHLDSDLAASISTLDEIWILHYIDNFELCREHQILIP